MEAVRILLVLVPVLALSAPAAGGTRPIPGASRVLVISVDGLRPDVLLRAETPVMRGLMDRGAFTMWARTTAVAVTLPSHTSMLTGVPPDRHGIVWNTTLPLSKPVWPARPTLFELARAAGYTTAMVAGKAKFAALAKPGTLDWWFVPGESAVTDAAVADSAVAVIRAHAPDVLFVHLPSADSVGHEHGWGSPEQIATVGEADRSVGRILEALRERGVADSTVVIVSADHGGAGETHGADDPRSRFIPWIIAGPGIRAGYDLTRDPDVDVDTEDTFATACWVLGLEVARPVDGRAVREACQDPALRPRAAAAGAPLDGGHAAH